MKGLVQGGAGAGSLEMTKSKSVMAGIRQRGWWDIVRFGQDEGKLEIQVEKDTMVDGGEVLKFELGSLRSEPLKECNCNKPVFKSIGHYSSTPEHRTRCSACSACLAVCFWFNQGTIDLCLLSVSPAHSVTSM